MKKSADLFRIIGLHPLVGFGMFAVDWMLFAAETGTIAVSWPVSIGVAAALTIPCVLVQRYSYSDEWGLAIGKALMVGVLTAVPTSLPSLVPLAGGVVGTASLLLGDTTSPEQ